MNRESDFIELKDSLSDISAMLDCLISTLSVLYTGLESGAVEENASHCMRVLLTYATDIKSSVDAVYSKNS